MRIDASAFFDDLVDDGVLAILPVGIVSFANAALAELTGVADRNALVGTSFAELFSGAAWREIHAAYFAPRSTRRPKRVRLLVELSPRPGSVFSSREAQRVELYVAPVYSKRRGSLHLQDVAARDGSNDVRTVNVLVRAAGSLSSAQQLDAAIRSAVYDCPAPICVTDVRGVIRFVNEAWSERSGYSRDEVTGQTPSILKSGLHSAAFYNEMWRKLSAGRRYRNRFVNRAADGSLYYLDQTITPFRAHGEHITHYVGLARDITGTLATREALSRTRGRFEAIATAIPDQAFLLDSDGRYHALSDDVGDLNAARGGDKERVGRWIADVLPICAVDSLLEAVRNTIERQESHSFEYQSRDRDGTERTYEGRAAPVSGELVALCAIRDITGRVELERELRHAHKMEAVGLLAGGVAHDLNNLLMAIEAYSTFIAESVSDNTQALEDVHAVRDAGRKASDLVERLLSFSRRRRLHIEPVDAVQRVREFGNFFSRVVGDTIELDVAVSVEDGWVNIDRGEFEQVILNLAVNARDAMPDGGYLRLDVSEDVLDSAACPKGLAPGRYVDIKVTDTGVGMEAATMERIFEPFFTTKAEDSGTGIGLATAYGIVQRAGGCLSANSQLGSGTTMRVLLPAREGGPVVDKEGGAQAEPGYGGVILLAEDDDAIRGSVCRILRDDGYTVIAASSVVDAKKKCMASKLSVDLLVTDVVMGGGSGALLSEHLPDVPVLYMSGYAESVINRHLGAGVEVLPKPFTVERLLSRVHNLLESRDKSQAREYCADGDC